MKRYAFYKIMMLCCILIVSSKAVEANYHLNENSLDSLFAKSQDVTQKIEQWSADYRAGLTETQMSDEENGPNYKVAAGIALATTILPAGVYVGWFFITAVTGGFGIFLLPGAMILAGAIGSPWHRYYLGTDDNSFKIGALYCITMNGFGLLGIADAISLFSAPIEHQEYINNEKFLIWLDEIEKQ
ncbi:hypothetical protein N8Z47_00220 [Salibacteraceae bacterium]|jgi:hypothetical protein|nr:hypothetical protein [Salibacteraceae bacterium]